MKWAEMIWREVEKTTLAYYSSETEHYGVILNLFSLAELFNIYNYLAFDEEYDRKYKYYEWVDELGLSKLKFILLAGDEFHDDEYIDEIWGPLDALIDKKYNDFVLELTKIIGGKDNLLISLEKSGNNFVEDEESFEEDDHIYNNISMENYSVSHRFSKIFDWKEQGFPRDYF